MSGAAYFGEELMEQVTAENAKWIKCFNAGDADGCASCYLEDCTMWPQPMDKVKGREAIRDWWKNLMGKGFKQVEYLNIKCIPISKDCVELYSPWRMNKAHGVVHNETWVRQPDGGFKMTWDHFEIFENNPEGNDPIDVQAQKKFDAMLQALNEGHEESFVKLFAPGFKNCVDGGQKAEDAKFLSGDQAAKELFQQLCAMGKKFSVEGKPTIEAVSMTAAYLDGKVSVDGKTMISLHQHLTYDKTTNQALVDRQYARSASVSPGEVSGEAPAVAERSVQHLRGIFEALNAQYVAKLEIYLK